MKRPARWRLSRRLFWGFALLAGVPILVVGLGIRQYTHTLLRRSFDERAHLTRRLLEDWQTQLQRRALEAVSDAAEDALLDSLLSQPDRSQTDLMAWASAAAESYDVGGIDLYRVSAGGNLLLARAHRAGHSGFPLQAPRRTDTMTTWPAPELNVVCYGVSEAFGADKRVGVAAYFQLDADLIRNLGQSASFLVGTTGPDGEPILSFGTPMAAWPAVADDQAELLETEIGGRHYAIGRVGPFYYGLPLAEQQSALGRLDLFLAISVLLAVAIAIIAAWRVTYAAARPVEDLAATVGQWGRGGDLGPLVTFAEGETATLADAFEHLRQELVAAERRLSDAARAAGWQEMARKVAHEIKNPLTPIRVTMEDLARQVERDPGKAAEMIPEAARLVAEEVTVLGRIVDSFSRLARLPEPSLIPTDLVAVASDTVKLYADGKHARIDFSAPDHPVNATADAQLLREALANLIKNAAEAAGPEGTVTVSLSTDSDSTTIAIGDSGPGFPEHFLTDGPRPYFTTKHDGTGLGLVVAQRIITDMGGDLKLTNSDHGARAQISFPTVSA